MQEFEKKIVTILTSRYSDVIIDCVTEIVRELEKIECESDDFTIKIDAEAIRKKIESSLVLIDESWDDLFSLHQRIIAQDSIQVEDL